MLVSSSVPRKATRTAARVIDGEAMVMVIDRRQLHRLNSVGSRVFELCDGTSNVDAIAQTIVREFDVTASVALSDVARFVTELAELGAVLLEDQP